jgi:ubiquinone/menaquinone biosynthesis C-methylase UbiE
LTDQAITLSRVCDVLTPHLPIYRWRKPVYQTTMLAALRDLWNPGDRRILDIGGGTGIIAQAVSELFPVDEVISIDVQDRFLSTLTIDAKTYDGRKIPFPDSSFDAVMFNNVIHHVPVEYRAALLVECRRVARSGVYIKDHVAASRLDHHRLAALDWIGNIPFGGMLWANYLSQAEWAVLAEQSGFTVEETRGGAYRSGPLAAVFPNSLEISMRWRSRAG